MPVCSTHKDAGCINPGKQFHYAMPVRIGAKGIPSSRDLQYFSRKNIWNTKSRPADTRHVIT
jgi:hypothetical protein